MSKDRISFAGALLAGLLGAIMTLVAAELLIRVAMPNWSEFHSGRFMDRVATIIPGFPPVVLARRNFDGYFAQNNGDFRVHIRINDFSLRDDTPVDTANGRLWVIGDSMAFGWGVERAETYTQVIADTSGLATYNVASPGTDVCGYQAMAARMPATLKPRAVVVGLILENDMRIYDCKAEGRETQEHPPQANAPILGFESWTEFKWQLTGVSALYNFLAVTLKRVGVLDELLVKIGLLAREHVEFDRFPRQQLDAVVASTAAALADLRDMLGRDTPYAVLIAPARFEIRDRDPFFRDMRVKMVAALAERGIDVVDPYEGFAAAGFAPTHFVHDGHWSRLGHKIAGEATVRWLKQHHESQ